MQQPLAVGRTDGVQRSSVSRPTVAPMPLWSDADLTIQSKATLLIGMMGDFVI